MAEPAAGKALGTNPKDALGVKKVSLTKIPSIAEVWAGLAMMDGAGKYGPYNWRLNAVVSSIYVDAAKRHLDLWFEGQEHASDSKVHHLGHAIACCAILLDAQATGNLVDDRPKGAGEILEKLMEEVKPIIEAMQLNHAKLKAEREQREKNADQH